MHVKRLSTESGSLGRSRDSMSTSTSSGCFAEEKPGVIKSGTMQGGFLPFKGKGKSMYVVLSERAIEIYENEKAYLKMKPSIHTIDLAIAFNVHNEHYHPKLRTCVCVMRPDDTLLLKAENELMNKEWFEAILSSAIPARALRLGRCVTPQEFFEAAYDVTIVETPVTKKGKKIVGKESPDANILEKHPELGGERRLCFYAHTIFLCQKNIEPARAELLNRSGIPPFKNDDVFEIQRRFVSRFAIRDNHFILMMGQGSPMGACEIFAECEDKKVATHIYHMLNAIINREAEKRKTLGAIQPETDMPSVASITRGHRVRSHTQPHRPRLISDIMAGNKNSPLAHLMRKSSTGTSVCLSGSHRTPPTMLEAPVSSRFVPRSVSDASQLLPRQRQSFDSISEDHLAAPTSVFPRRESSDSKGQEASIYQSMEPTDDAKIREIEQLMRGELPQGYRSASPSTSGSFAEETEDSGGTIIAFDDVRRNNSIRNLSLMQQQSPKDFVSIKCETGNLSPSAIDADANLMSPGTNTNAGVPTSPMCEKDYEYMDIANWDREGTNFDLPPYVFTSYRRSNVSSSDSCYSSPSDRLQRHELDFGGGEPSPSTSSHRGLSSYGSVSLGSVESSSRTSSFGCKSVRDEGFEKQNGLTPSEILLQKKNHLSIEECANEDGSDYVFTGPRLFEEEDEYTEMEVGCTQPLLQPTDPAAAAAALCQLTPNDSRQSSRDPSIEPSSSSAMHLEGSNGCSALPSVLPPSEEPAAASEVPKPVLDAHPPAIPKRSSVPVLKAMVPDSDTLNYACLQVNNGCAPSATRPRRRSNSSGLVKIHQAAAAAAGAEYARVTPL